MAPVTVDKDGRSWRIGTADDVAWIAGHTIDGLTVTNAIPPRFDAYATFYQPEGVHITLHERTVVDILKAHTAEQPWWLGYLDTGAHDVVFNTVPMVTLYWGWASRGGRPRASSDMADRSHARWPVRRAARPVLPR